MSHFRGKYDYVADETGRVNMPAKFRKALNPGAAETFVICRAPENCLRAFPQDTWEKYEQEISSRQETPETVRFRRLLYNTVTDSTLDAQGRITLSPSQMKIASITKNVTLIGMNDFIEIWDTATYGNCVGDGGDFDQVHYGSAKADMKKSAPQ
jgi:MraZ protein